MPNLTPLFFELVGPTAPKKALPKHAFDKEADTANSLISELQAFLTEVRPSYLSVRTLKEGRNESELARALRYGARADSNDSGGANASKSTHMTDKQRNEVDYETKSAVQNLTRKIRALEKWTEDEKRKKNEKKGGFLSSLMKDELQEGVEKTQEQHRDAVLWYLNDRLRAVSEMQQTMQEQRLARERERVMSRNNVVVDRPTLGASAARTETDVALDSGEKTTSEPFDSTISPEMIQQLETEHAELLDSLQGKLGKVHEAEKSLYEISEMQNELTMHLASQSEKIQSLINDANQTTVDVGDANKNLESAKSRNRKASRMIIGISLFLAFLLLFYDYMMW
ncbi:Syntaxin UFE1 [Yarrowia sp. C11]|nr:Syntaxin UFE1 [Yarrowia sp. C11]